MRADLRTHRGATVQPDARPARRPVPGDAAGVGSETLGRILSGDAALHRRAAHRDRILAESQIGQRLPRRDAQLAGDEIDVGDLLGDGVLDLDARIQLDEDVVAALVEQELDGARARIADLPREGDRVVTDLGPQLL